MLYNLFEDRDFVSVFAVALLAEGVDRNSLSRNRITGDPRSPSSRRAWIEIAQATCWSYEQAVALLAEGVDRNNTLCFPVTDATVALLAEGVDRNVKKDAFTPVQAAVALLAEGVDRN